MEVAFELKRLIFNGSLILLIFSSTSDSNSHTSYSTSPTNRLKDGRKASRLIPETKFSKEERVCLPYYSLVMLGS